MRKRLGLADDRFADGGLAIESFADAHALAAELRASLDGSLDGRAEDEVGAAELAALDLLQQLATTALDRVVGERDPELLGRAARRLLDHFGEERGHALLARLAIELGLAEAAESDLGGDGDAGPAPGESVCIRELLVLALLARHGGARRILRRLGLDDEADPELAETLSVAEAFLHDAGTGSADADLDRLMRLIEGRAVEEDRGGDEREAAADSGFDRVLEALLEEPEPPWRVDPRRVEAVLGLIAESRAPRFAAGHAPEPEIGLGEPGEAPEEDEAAAAAGSPQVAETADATGPGYPHSSPSVPTVKSGRVGGMSRDADWMPNLVLLAKNTLVWLDQLSRVHGRLIERLDDIPDEALEEIAWRGFNGLWLVGIWERSEASARIKSEQGQANAAPSAYSVKRYRIAPELGGEEALRRLTERAARHGIRLAADFVPNHTAIDSDWVIRHPERFLSVDEPPFPSYRFTGTDLSPSLRIRLRIEDHYRDHSDAAVVFERTDRKTGQRRYIYHGNDGTATPWNDTAQLDYLEPATREAVIGTIVEVARRFPILRFDAAMTLARQHLHRLWYPAPAHAGAVPSRAEHGMSDEAFAERMPREIWLDVVERLRVEAPGTLLLAEAFWLMEGYFVRKLGLHRVYNSAFMHMVRDGKTARLHRLIADTLALERGMLGRFVNYLSTPDEAPAIAQFGSGDRYFGACRLLATMPGLPLFAHGQWEGFEEKYGMEFERARTDDQPNREVIERHDRDVAPILARRPLFTGVDRFRLLELRGGDGSALDSVLAFVNRKDGEGVVVAFNNAAAHVSGRLREPEGKATDGAGQWADLVGVANGALRDLTGSRRVAFRVEEARREGLEIELEPYECAVLVAGE